MADAITPVSRVEMDPNFEKRLRECKDQAEAEYTERLTGRRAKWSRPAGYEGNLFDFEAMQVPFDREAINQKAVDAVKDANAPGVTGDIVAATTMIDELSCMERAYRARHTMGRARATALMLGRKKGQGHQKGPFIQCGVEYVRAVIAQAKKKP